MRKLFALLLALALLCSVALAEGTDQKTPEEMVRESLGLEEELLEQFTQILEELEELEAADAESTWQRRKELAEQLERRWMEQMTEQPDDPLPSMLAVDGSDLRAVPGNQELLRSQIVSIEFHADLSDKPEDAWDASACGDGSVMAWTEETEDGCTLIIAANGPVKAPTNSRFLFVGYTDVTHILFDDAFDTSGTVNVGFMFSGCNSLVEADMSGLDLSSVTDLWDVLSGCPGEPSLNIELPARPAPKFGGLG